MWSLYHILRSSSRGSVIASHFFFNTNPHLCHFSQLRLRHGYCSYDLGKIEIYWLASYDAENDISPASFFMRSGTVYVFITKSSTWLVLEGKRLSNCIFSFLLLFICFLYLHESVCNVLLPNICTALIRSLCLLHQYDLFWRRLEWLPRPFKRSSRCFDRQRLSSWWSWWCRICSHHQHIGWIIILFNQWILRI